MATVSAINGVAVNVGFAGTPGGLTITSPAISTNLILQSTDESQGASMSQVDDEVGNRAARIWTDPHTKATLEFIIKGTGLANVITVTQLIEGILPGSFMTISACQQQPGLVGTNWEVQDSPKVSGDNKNAKKFTVSVERAAGITGPAPA